MKTSIPICLLIAGILLPGMAQAQLPATYKEFKARYQSEARTPKGALKLHMEAIFCYLNPETRKEASKMVRYSMYLSKPLEQSYNLATFAERLRTPGYEYIFRSFCEGTSPDNDYAMDPDNFRLSITDEKVSGNDRRIALQSSGADSERWMLMRKHDGLWYTEINTGLYAMVREPKSVIDSRKNSHDADFDEPEQKKNTTGQDVSAPAPRSEKIPAGKVPAVNTPPLEQPAPEPAAAGDRPAEGNAVQTPETTSSDKSEKSDQKNTNEVDSW